MSSNVVDGGGVRKSRAPLTNLAVTNGNKVRLCFNDDAKSSALTARCPRHGNSPPGKFQFASLRSSER
jgi:hypothetical protein